MAQVTINVTELLPGDAALKAQYLQQIASVAEMDTLRILAELSKKPGVNNKIQKNERMLKSLL